MVVNVQITSKISLLPTVRVILISIAEAAELFGLSWCCLESRISRKWSIKKALETPTGNYQIKRTVIVHNGISMTITQACKINKISYRTFYQRRRYGWSALLKLRSKNDPALSNRTLEL